jgi:opacity protein-like surface antigen
MASKKFTLLVSLVIAGATAGYSQLGGTIDYQDSTKINKKKLPQYNEWKNNSKTNVFPPVPKAQGQLSVYGGLLLTDADAPTEAGYNVGVSYRKALGYVVSIRGGIGYGVVKGLDYKQSAYLYNNPVLTRNYSRPSGPGYYVHSHKTTVWTPSLDMIFSLNNIMFHRAKSKFNFYGLVGWTPLIYQTKLDALNGSAPYNYNNLSQNFFARPRKDIRSDLKNFFDGDYETDAVVRSREPNFDQSGNGKPQIRHSFNLGGGMEFRIASRMSLGLEFKYIMANDDYIDGWYLGQAGALTPEKDNLFVTNLHINFNL